MAGDVLEVRKWHFPVWALVFCFSISSVTLIVYFSDTYFSDETLFILLAVLKFSSYVVCICSLYKLAVSIFRIFRRPSVFGSVKIFLYFVSFVYGAAVVFFESFVNVISRGNG